MLQATASACSLPFCALTWNDERFGSYVLGHTRGGVLCGSIFVMARRLIVATFLLRSHHARPDSDARWPLSCVNGNVRHRAKGSDDRYPSIVS